MNTKKTSYRKIGIAKATIKKPSTAQALRSNSTRFQVGKSSQNQQVADSSFDGRALLDIPCLL